MEPPVPISIVWFIITVMYVAKYLFEFFVGEVVKPRNLRYIDPERSLFLTSGAHTIDQNLIGRATPWNAGVSSDLSV